VGAAALSFVPAITLAATLRVGEQATIPAGETVAHNAYLIGGSVLSSGPVGGDLVATGGTVVVNDPVSGDVMGGGGNVSILGAVAGDLRMGGGTLVVSGPIGGDLVAGGGQITVTSPKIGGDVLMAAGTVHLSAPVSGSATIRGGSVVIDAPISGDLEVHAQSLTLGSHAVISGNLTYEAPKAATMETGASVKGKTVFTPIVDVSVGPEAAFALLSVWILSVLASLIVSALIVRMLFRRYVVELGNAVLVKSWRALGVGFVALVVIPAAGFVMMLTVVGIPLGMLTFVSYAALLVFSWMMAPIVIGAFIEKWWYERSPQMPWQVIVYGAIAYSLIGILPIIGGIFKFVVILITLGSVIEKKWEIAAEWV
jgi:cytoskeletal protein CcmA (bactofilin family)